MPAAGPDARLEWDYGDGTPTENLSLNAMHVFAKPGDYSVTLTAYDEQTGRVMGRATAAAKIGAGAATPTTTAEAATGEWVLTSTEPSKIVDEPHGCYNSQEVTVGDLSATTSGKCTWTGPEEAFETFAKKDMDICLSANLPAITQSHALLGLAAFWKGDWKSALEHFHKGGDAPSAGIYVGLDWATLIKATGYAEPPGAAESMLRRTKAQSMAGMGLKRSLSLTLRLVMAARFSSFPLGTLFEVVRQMRRSTMNDYLPRAGRPNSLGSWVLLTAVIEGLLANGQRQAAGRFYSLMVEALKRSGSLISVPDPRMFETTAGLAASAAKCWPDAEQHFETAMRRADDLPHRLEQPEVRRFYAGMLIDRNTYGDRDKARLLLREAVAMYREIGMPKHQALAESSLANAMTPG